MKELYKYKLRAFTLVELLIGLILASITITFAYSTLNYANRLFRELRDQNRFINEFCRLNSLLQNETSSRGVIIYENENQLNSLRDSVHTRISFKEKAVVVERMDFVDTFHIIPGRIDFEFEKINHPAWAGKLIRSVNFSTEYNKQKFNFYFRKNYDASVKMKLELNN